MLKLKLPYFGHMMWTASLEKTLMLGKIEGRRIKGRQRMKWLDEMHYWLNGHEFEQALGVGDRQGGLVCCSPWGCKQLYTLSDWTELNWTMLYLVASVVSDSLWPHGLQFARLLCPWGFSRKEYWSGLPCSPLRDLLEPGIKPVSLKSPTMAGRFFTTSATWKAHSYG